MNRKSPVRNASPRKQLTEILWTRRDHVIRSDADAGKRARHPRIHGPGAGGRREGEGGRAGRRVRAGPRCCVRSSPDTRHTLGSPTFGCRPADVGDPRRNRRRLRPARHLRRPEAELVAYRCKWCLCAGARTGRQGTRAKSRRRSPTHLAAAEERARQAELDRVRLGRGGARPPVRIAEQRKRRRCRRPSGCRSLRLVVLGGTFAWWAADQRRTQSRRGGTQRLVEGNRPGNRSSGGAVLIGEGAGNDLTLWRRKAPGGSPRCRPERAGSLRRSAGAGRMPSSPRSSGWRRTAGLLPPCLTFRRAWGTTVGERHPAGLPRGRRQVLSRLFRDWLAGTSCSCCRPRRASTCSATSAAGVERVQLYPAALDDWAYVLFVVLGAGHGATRTRCGLPAWTRRGGCSG